MIYFWCAFRWYKPVCTLECEEQTGLAKRRLEVESRARGGNGGTASCKGSLTDGQKEGTIDGDEWKLSECSLLLESIA